MAYNKDGTKLKRSKNKRVVKYKANKGADFEDGTTGSGLTTKSIKTKTKYDKEGEIKKIKRVKKTEGGGRMVTVSKPGLENNSLSPEGSTGLVTTRERKNKKLRKDLNSMAKAMGKIRNPIAMVEGDGKNIARVRKTKDFTSRGDQFRVVPEINKVFGKIVKNEGDEDGKGRRSINVTASLDEEKNYVNAKLSKFSEKKGRRTKEISNKRATRILNRIERKVAKKSASPGGDFMNPATRKSTRNKTQSWRIMHEDRDSGNFDPKFLRKSDR
tara:strand:- start:630 stop:1442 length:813 start_codon:yes stop_codon:yes gene_type:complete